MRNIRMVLQYDGSLYRGWQRQKTGVTIQAVLEEQLRVMTGDPTTLIASGRTDAGVHALHQVCHFVTASKIEPQAFQRGLNSLLPKDIRVVRAEDVSLDFHARYSVKTKTYEYRILNRQDPDVFLRHYAWHVPFRLDLLEMRRCLSALIGRHDFASFRSSGSGNRDPVRTMARAEIRGPEPEGILRFVFEANGFLRHMVRNMVGTIVDVGRGKMDYEGFMRIFQAGDRRLAGMKAPSCGLYLTMVSY